MENINIGVAKSIVSNKLSGDFITTRKINESKNIASHFYFLIENSELLQDEFDVFRNLEEKHITNDVLATRYIDENISILSKYTIDDINEAHSKLKSYIDDSDIHFIDESKLSLYNAINNLIVENAQKRDGKPDVDLIHESFSIVLDHIKTNEKPTPIVENEMIDNRIDMSQVLEMAIDKFKTKYSKLDESEIKLVNTLVLGSSEEKEAIFESLKNENLDILSTIDTTGIENKIDETVDKLTSMKYSDESSIKDVITLFELKNNLS